MNKNTAKLIERIKGHLTKIYEEKVRDGILRGSYVKCEYTKDPDVDILVFIDPSHDPFKVRTKSNDLLFDILVAHFS